MANAAVAPVQAVALKLPPFWTAQPAVWFQQAEAQFAIRGIVAEQTKYYYVLSALDQTTAGRHGLHGSGHGGTHLSAAVLPVAHGDQTVARCSE